jgi:putative oxidoreductase
MRMGVRQLLFGGDATTSRAGDAGLLILRVFAGLALALAHGMGKVPPQEGFVGMLGGLGIPAPHLAAWLSGIAEFGGGILLALGLLTRPAALLIVINMAVALIFAHAGDTFGERELPLLFFFIALAYLLKGAGRFSLDAMIRGRRV